MLSAFMAISPTANTLADSKAWAPALEAIDDELPVGADIVII